MKATHRQILESALDRLAARASARQLPTPSELRKYEQAVAIVRDLPPGARRLRSDFNGKRETPQQDLVMEETA